MTRWEELAYRKLMRSAGSVAGVRALIDAVRAHRGADPRGNRRRSGAGAQGSRRGRRCENDGWLWYMDGAILDWLEHRDMKRAELRELLLDSLAGALVAAGWTGPVG